VSWLQRLAAFVSVFVLAVSGLALVDTLTAPPSAAPAAVADTQGEPPGRVFVLVIDSLRYETAISAELMPHLYALRARGTFARVTPTRDAVTVPCLRAAFTGRDRTRVFGFVENFLKGNAGLESLFTALAQRGGSAAVYSDGAFDQFGEQGITRLSNGDPVAEGGESEDHSDHVEEQTATLPIALAEYQAGKRDLVVLHVTYTDHVAHEVGVGAPLYKERYRAADALVARLDRELPASDTLVVMGDHGHDATGRHAVGLDVPTYALYRGPRFAAGVDLGTMAIRDHRYLLGFALGVSLPGDYAGARHSSALRPGPAGLGSYGAAAGGGQEISPGVEREAYAGYVLGGLVLALWFAVWFVLAARAARMREGACSLGAGAGSQGTGGTHSALSATSNARLAQAQPASEPPGATPRRSTTALSETIASQPAHEAEETALPPPRLSALLAGLGATVICGLGVLFPRVRSLVHEPSLLTIVSIWFVLWGVALVLGSRTQKLAPCALVLGLPLFFLVPTVYRYGAPAAMAPAWLGLLACIFVLQRRRPPLTAAALLCALLVPFGLAESSGFRFDEWVLAPPGGFLLLSFVAKWIVLVPPDRSAKNIAVGVAGAGLASAVQLGWVPYHLQLLAAGVLLPFCRVHRTAAVTALLVLHHYAVRLPASAYYWQDCLLAALVLSARIVKDLPAPTRTLAHAALLLLAFFASGWVSFAWTLHRLEWAFLYDFWSAAFVERNVASFLPLLMGRFALPLIAARVLLREELPEAASGQRALGLAWLLSGSKVASLMFWSYGTAFVSVASDVYLEAVQETSLACVLLLGLL